ncbi:MAG: hypothetical protein Q9175_006212 [Cornicularia normoerica]
MDSVPTQCTVLVVGGGPGGSYTASALAREGISTALLEADVFPRYHVGESMVASIRHFLRFIDLDSTFNNHGFVKKTGAAFKLNNQRDAYTDFIVSAGPDSYAWNVVRSESDNLMFQHARKSGAKTFDGVKVTAIEWAPLEGKDAVNGDMVANVDPGRPVSASWARKDGSSGEIKFDYLVDASGRAGIVSTKYLKNRSFNQDLKNVANWGYWKGAISYGVGTPKEGQPFFEALHDGSGWAWFIPLHNGTTSVGVVMNQAMSTDKKRTTSLNSREFYLESIQEARGVSHLLSKAELATDIKYASDWSYSASTYGNAYLRIVGDAGAFIDPYFSSGVHLALSGALSAAVTISAAIRGDTDEQTAWKWHSNGVAERYTRFLLVVLGATKQIRHKDAPVMNDSNEDGFDRAFSIIRPVIQGIADVRDGKTSQTEISKAVDFTYNAVQRNNPDEREAVLAKLTGTNGTATDTEAKKWQDVGKEAFSTDEARVLKMVKDTFADYFTVDAFDGMVANLERGKLGLVKSAPNQPTLPDEIDEKQPFVEMTPMPAPIAAGV